MGTLSSVVLSWAARTNTRDSCYYLICHIASINATRNLMCAPEAASARRFFRVRAAGAGEGSNATHPPWTPLMRSTTKSRRAPGRDAARVPMTRDGVMDKPIPSRSLSTMVHRHLSRRRIKLPPRKYNPIFDGKVHVYIDCFHCGPAVVLIICVPKIAKSSLEKDLVEGKRLYLLDAGSIMYSLCFSLNRYWLCADSVKTWDLESKHIV
ncbi:hypothetical protein Zm00014a_030785 [Zea mays]|uniref:Uncharacterized protein n=1 Tax=Zea mays TaxID=4577 RepID=A0A3L6EJM6_MAIZE|nr:hypothetical protein Zm00014a_030785 [Zea mays]